MKKLYKSPILRGINLVTEGVIATSGYLQAPHIDENAESNEGNLLSNKQENLWGREGIWK